MRNLFDEKISRRHTSSMKWDVKENELPMWVADMDFRTAPEVTEAIIERAKHGIFGYTVVPDAWYDAIIGWWEKRYSFRIEKEWMQFCTGVVPAISSIVKRVTNIGDKVVALTPVYDIFFHSIENAGRSVLESRLVYDGKTYAIDFTDLEAKLSDPLTTLLIFCNPHNPVGKVWTAEEMAKVGELCHRYGVTVLTDEIHCDLSEVPYTPFASVSELCKENTIMCLSASKAFNLAGLQSAAVVIANEQLRNKVVRGLNSDEVAEPNCFAVEGTVAAFTKGEAWLAELNRYISENKQYAAQFFAEKVPEIHLTESKATYLLWLDCSAFVSDAQEFCDYLRQTTGLYLSAGNQYRGNGDQFVRMNIACHFDTLKDGLYRLESGIRAYMELLKHQRRFL